MKRLLITGGTGFLGAEIIRHALKDLPDLEIHATKFSHEPIQSEAIFHQLDLTDRIATIRLLESLRPECILHTAATMGSDGLEPPDAPGVAEPLIVAGTSNLARWCAHAGARLIHLSTDVVFSGSHAPYNECARPDPIHRYGMAKYRAELEILRLRTKSVIVRTSLIYGFSPPDIRTDALINGTMIRFFTDEFRNPIWVVDLARALLELVNLEFEGILNVAGPERMSRYEFAKKTLARLGIDREIVASSIAESGLLRAADCSLELTLSTNVLKTHFNTIEEIP